MPEPTMLVTREEFDLVKEEQKRVSIRLEVLEDGLTSLTREVAGMREEMDSRFDAVDRRFDAVDRRFEAVDRRFDVLEKKIDDGNAALMSAILTLGKR